MKISKNKKCVSFSYPKDHSTQKLGSYVKRCALQPGYRQTDKNYQCYKRLSIKSVKMKISKSKKCVSFSYPTDPATQKFDSQQTDRHESDYCGHPFRVSGVFPSTCHQGLAQKCSSFFLFRHVFSGDGELSNLQINFSLLVWVFGSLITQRIKIQLWRLISIEVSQFCVAV